MRQFFVRLLHAVFAIALGYGCAQQVVPPTSPDAGAKVVALAPPDDAARTRLDVHFSPKGGCGAAITALIDSAKTSIRVQAYGFTSLPLADALARAKARGVDVRVVLDRSDLAEPQKNERTPIFRDAGIPVLYDFKHVIAHNKIMVVDMQKVETGSYNFTTIAETGNAENCLIVDNLTLASEYGNNWVEHAAHSWPGDAAAP